MSELCDVRIGINGTRKKGTHRENEKSRQRLIPEFDKEASIFQAEQEPEDKCKKESTEIKIWH
jgi:hypothetical protein